MIHNDIQNQLQLLIKGSSAPLIEVAEHPIQTPEWTLGQRLPAHVLASLPNGRFQVQIENQILDMNLPRNTQPGTTLELAYAGNSPRLTFVLTSEQAAIASTLNAPGDAIKLNVSPAATAAAKAADAKATDAKAADGPDTALNRSAESRTAHILDAPVVLSNTAKFLGSLQQKNTADTAATVVQGKEVPVLNAPPGQAQPFAEALSNTLSQSGLFYESHQLQWISGERSLAMLRQEPQAQLAASAAVAQNSPVLELKQVVPIIPPVVDDVPQTLVTHSEPLAGSVSAQTLPLVQQQLEVLDSRQIVWQGQVWPGQQMRWEIEEDASSPRAAQEQASAWNTSLRLSLPRLGGVTANIAFNPKGVRVDFVVARQDSAELLKSEQQALVQSFDAAGLSLKMMTVKQNEQASQPGQA